MVSCDMIVPTKDAIDMTFSMTGCHVSGNTIPDSVKNAGTPVMTVTIAKMTFSVVKNLGVFENNLAMSSMMKFMMFIY
jgi:hypothetical protein